MKRREFLAGVAGMAAIRAEESRKHLLLLSSDDARNMQETVRRHAGLRRLADAALEKGPWNVTAHRPNGIDVPDHEYYSEGPYWWPDPKNPDGPYIRKDGERNPGRFDDNHRDLGAMCTAALALGIAAHFFGDDRYAGHARRILSTWFVDPATRMNPNLEYGQAVRGISTGRGTGIIDTVSLIHAVQGIVLLEDAGKLDAALSSGLRRWFAEYLRWMTTSEKGLDEKKSGNNHATWWTAQVAAYATYLNDEAAQKMAWDHYRTVLLGQIQPDGSCPREEARTRSLSYSTFNLDAFSVLCRIAEVAGVDLWRFHTPQGLGVDKAIAYITPFVVDPKTWRKQQIAPVDNAGIVFPALAGLGLRNAELLRIYSALPRANTPWVLLVDLIVKKGAEAAPFKA
jgi:hypothetical protein